MSPDEASISNDWRIGSEIVELPGNRHAKIRRRPLTAFYKAGKIPNAIMPLVREAFVSNEVRLDVKDFTDEQLMDLLRMMDMVIIECVEEPKVHPAPICRTCHGSGEAEREVGPKNKKTKIKVDCPSCGGMGEEDRQPDRVYADEVPFDVKNFIYNYVIGAVDDLESFRDQSAGSVEPVSERQAVEDKTKQSVGTQG